MASGVIPQLSAVMGPCAGGAVYSPAMTDFIFMVQGTSFMFVTGPDVVKTVTHEVIDFEGLGGASIHSGTSGVAHFAADDEAQCLDQMRRLVGFLPSNNLDDAPRRPTSDPTDRMDAALDTIVPDQPTRSYDMHSVILGVVDDRDFLEVHGDFAQNIIVGFAHLGGRSVGIVAQQPTVLAGVLDINASVKALRPRRARRARASQWAAAAQPHIGVGEVATGRRGVRGCRWCGQRAPPIGIGILIGR